jgi:IS5 family transposase
MSANHENQYSEELQLYQRAVNQHKNDKNKVYSTHKPFTGCISKGKPHKKYEFGNKVSIITLGERN